MRAPLAGAAALVVRGGGCSFVAKYLAVLAAGGSAVLVFNDAPGCVTMGGSLSNDTAAGGGNGGGNGGGGDGGGNGAAAAASRLRAGGEAGAGASSGGDSGDSGGDSGGGSGKEIPAISIDRVLGVALLNATASSSGGGGGGGVRVTIALLDLPPVDAGAALLWLMAVGTVAAGAVWAGRDHAAALKAAALGGDGSGGADGGRRGGGGRRASAAGGDDALDVTAGGAVAFVASASAMLLLLYFFMSRVFLYIIVGAFALSAAQALTLMLAAALAAAWPALEARARDVPYFGETPLPVLIAAPPACAAALVWVAFRNAAWSWPLLDALGVALMLLVLRTLRLGSLRAACVLLPLCFAYDVFFVFIQPRLFGGGDSVMVEVARGAGADEALPMLLRVPRLSGPAVARGGYSMLGYGDVIIPGLLVAFARRADAEARAPWPRGYFAPALAAYAAGLVLTYVALVFSWFGDQGQPALLYLVPCTLGAFLARAAARGELGAMWRAGGGDDEEGEQQQGGGLGVGGGGGGSGEDDDLALLLPRGGGGSGSEAGGSGSEDGAGGRPRSPVSPPPRRAGGRTARSNGARQGSPSSASQRRPSSGEPAPV